MVKEHLKSALETGFLGRPVRKILWLAYQFGLRMHQFTALLWDRHPYVQKLNRASAKKFDPDAALLRYYRTLKDSLTRVNHSPLISVIIPVYKVEPRFLKECLDSVAAQIYSNWEVCIVDDCSNDPRIAQVISTFQSRFPGKVHCKVNEANLHISRSSNRALEMAKGEFVALLDHDDRLSPNALGEVTRYINLNPLSDIFYSDECIINEVGEILGTYHKPGWSPIMHLSVNYTTHLSVYRRDFIRALGGFRAGFEGAQDHDLMLRASEATSAAVVHIPLNLYQWRSHKDSTAKDSGAKPYAGDAGMKALKEACERRGTPADITFEPQFHHYKVSFLLRNPAPTVSIIIPTRDGFELIKPCVDSIFGVSKYRDFEVILIDHETSDQRCLSYFDEMKRTHVGQFQVISYSGIFNFAEMNNLGARHAKGEFLLLLNNDTEVLTPDWLHELLALGQLPGVGAVGPKLLFPNKKIQHAGIIGLGPFIAGHSAQGERGDSLSYFAYFQTTHEVLAVTGACLLVAKDKYLQVDGLESTYIPNGFGDIDFCLKLKNAGYSNVYVPYATLIHKESFTRAVTFELFESHYMLQKWPRELLNDPYRNVSLEVSHQFRTDERYKNQALSPAGYQRLMNEMVTE